MIGIHDALPEDLGNGTAANPRRIVDVWLAVPGAPPSALMLRRAQDHGGFWQGVSGGLERSDPSLAGAALRELREETGIDLDPSRLYDLRMSVTFTSPFSGRAFTKRSLGALLPAHTTVESIELSAEHVEARIVSFDEARLLVGWPENAEELTAFERVVHP